MTTTSAPVEAGTRPRGRPRSAEAERAILDAALQELADAGADRFSVEAVATRAGVGKATIYRRWSGRDALVLDALTALGEELLPAVGGLSARADLAHVLDAVRENHQGSVHERLLPRVMAAAQTHPDLMKAYRERVIEPRKQLVRAVIERGVESGELRADLDLDLALQVVVFPMLFAVTMRTDPEPLPEDFAVRMVALVFDGLSA